MMKFVRMFSLFMLLVCSAVSFGHAQEQAPFEKGETLTYAIKNLGLKVGNARLEYLGKVNKNSRNFIHVRVTFNVLNFEDEENIYLDTLSFYPRIIERNILLFGNKEFIVEEYLNDQGMVKITKTTEKETTTQTIEKEGVLDNIYGLIYRYRKNGKFELNERLACNLPTKDLVLEARKFNTIKTGLGKLEALYLQSDPKEYRLWFEKSARRIPLRIDGAVGVGNASMILEDYQKK